MSYSYNKYKNHHKSNMICQNCGKKGHHFRNCNQPKNSFGIITYKRSEKINKYLIICRRNTIGFVQFIRGKYVLSDIEYINKLFNVMTNVEIDVIKNNKNNFKYLWEYLWLDHLYNKSSDNIRKDYESAEKKFNQIKFNNVNGGINNNINYFIDNKTQFYVEPEWGFPKGRRSLRDYSEKDTAIREFCEETNIDKNKLKFSEYPEKVLEEYKSYDNIDYKNSYFVSEYLGDNVDFKIDIKNKEQFTEVSNIGFFTLDECRDKIRDYSTAKIRMLENLDYILNKTLG